jgi:hypothetical protein
VIPLLPVTLSVQERLTIAQSAESIVLDIEHPASFPAAQDAQLPGVQRRMRPKVADQFVDQAALRLQHACIAEEIAGLVDAVAAIREQRRRADRRRGTCRAVAPLRAQQRIQRVGAVGPGRQLERSNCGLVIVAFFHRNYTR